jgi:hypothetical protein
MEYHFAFSLAKRQRHFSTAFGAAKKDTPAKYQH